MTLRACIATPAFAASLAAAAVREAAEPALPCPAEEPEVVEPPTPAQSP